MEIKDLNFRDLIERVRERTDIVQVIGRHIPLGRSLKALCPFHEEEVPSFSVNPKGQYFYCFGCKTGGDVFRFLELYEDKSFIEVLTELAGSAGIPIKGLNSEERKRIDEDRIIGDILTETARFYHRNLSEEAKNYITKKRCLTEEIISYFKIGYAGGNLKKHLIDQCGYPVDLCIEAGVLKRNDEGVIRDYYYNRIIFPNFKHGRVVHISGRSLNGHEPKYLHLSGEIRYIYNEDDLKNKEVILCEGVTDCISAVQAGYSAVAVLGTSVFKLEYLQKFSNCEKIYICFDGDRAGEEGAIKIGEVIGDRSRIVKLPEGLDLNDYFKTNSKDDFNCLLTSAMDNIRYELSLIPENTDKIELTRYLDKTIKKLAVIEKVKAEAYLRQEIKPRFKLKKEEVDGYRELINKYRKKKDESSNKDMTDLNIDSEYKAYFDGLVDLVEQDGNPAFLIKEENNLSIHTHVEKDGVYYVPPPKDQIPWLLPRGEEVLKYYELKDILTQQESDGALYDDLLSYHMAISELPGEEYYDLMAAWDLHTYLLESVQYSPIICLFAVPERGKSRTGKGMIYVAYRGIHVESLREAYLIRVTNDLKASVFFDVKDIWRKAEKERSEDILLQRFEKGAKVPRVMYPEKGAHQDIVYYSIFGPTIIGTNEGVHRILETRAVNINMPETERRFENDVRPELSLPLKERLVAFRARHLGETLSNIQKPASGRLGDILKPIQQIIRLVRPEREPYFLRFIKELEAERLIEKADTIEAQILITLVGLKDQVEKGILAVKEITDSFNEGKPEKLQVTYQRVGRRLKAMGFKKARYGNNSAILWDEKHLERMVDKYGLRETHEIQEMDKSSDLPT